MSLIIQRSPEWYSWHAGKLGCSDLGDVLATGKSGGPSTTRQNLMVGLVCERLTGRYEPNFHTKDIDHGVEFEGVGRSEYEARKGVMVLEDGGKEHDTIKGWGCSPDGLISTDGGLEIKCPKQSTHMKTILYGTFNIRYLYQMTGGVIIYDREYWDFESYHPYFPDNISCYIKRFYRKDLPIDKVKSGVVQFLDELNDMVEKVKKIGMEPKEVMEAQGGKRSLW